MSVIKAVTAVLLVTSLAFWVVMLGGIASVDSDCPGCARVLDFIWWTVFLELFVILLSIFAAFVPMVLSRFGGFVSAMLAISTVLLMLMSDNLNTRAPTDGMRAAMAGSVTLCITNLIYLFMVNDNDGHLLPVLRGGAVSGVTRSAPTQSPPVSVVQSTEFRGHKAGDVESTLPPPNLPAYAPPAAPGAPHVVS